MTEITVDTYEPARLAELLGAEVQPLPVGDVRLETESRTVLIERKTWDDAYGSWQSQRLEDQISRLLTSN